MDEGRKRVIGIIAEIPVARHLKNTDDLFDSKGSPRTEAMVAAAVQWAERILKKVDNVREHADLSSSSSSSTGPKPRPAFIRDLVIAPACHRPRPDGGYSEIEFYFAFLRRSAALFVRSFAAA